MYSKAVLIDFKRDDIDEKYFSRVNKLFKITEFISRDDSALTSKIKDAEAIFAKISTKINKEIMDAAPQLKYIGVLSTAYDAIDAKYARSKGVDVCNLGGYSTEAVSEFFFAVLLEHLRDLERAKNQARKEDYSFDKFMGTELQGKTLGVVGAGKIGSRIATIGAGFGMKVVYFARKDKPEIEKLGAKRMELNDVLSQSDVVDIALSLNESTKGIISKDKLNIVKKGCIVISLAPPDLIDSDAIMEKAGKGDLTFIFDHSDDIETSLAKRFLNTKNCIVYPPTAFRTGEANTSRWETFVSNIEQFAKNNPQNVVNS